MIIHADAWASHRQEAASRLAWWYYLAPAITTLGLLLYGAPVPPWDADGLSR